MDEGGFPTQNLLLEIRDTLKEIKEIVTGILREAKHPQQQNSWRNVNSSDLPDKVDYYNPSLKIVDRIASLSLENLLLFVACRKEHSQNPQQQLQLMMTVMLLIRIL